MTGINTARRSFLRGRLSETVAPSHLPWARADFTDRCQRCGDCITRCEETILVSGDGGYPSIDFGRGGCTFCGACAEACRYDAFDRRDGQAWSLKATVGSRCLSARGITCHACADICELRAIRFRLEPGGRAVPGIESSLCNGCGSCISTCPIQVIQIQEAA